MKKNIRLDIHLKPIKGNLTGRLFKQPPGSFIMETFEDDNPKNIYVIKRKLSTYKMLPGERNWEFRIGHFTLIVRLVSNDYWAVTDHGNNIKNLSDIRIINYETFDIDLYEDFSKDPPQRHYLYINKDSRFKDYAPIHYNIIETPTGGRINCGDGKNIPLLQLMELIRLLHRLSNLSVFV